MRRDSRKNAVYRLALILLVSLAFSFTASGMEIEEVFSTTEVSEYNRWLRDHAEVRLPPIYITVGGPAWRESCRRPFPASRASFYDNAGNLVRELKLDEPGSSVSVSPTRDRLFVYRRNQLEGTDGMTSSLTVYDSQGNIAFEVDPACIVTPSYGLVFRSVWLGYEPLKDTLEVLGARGNVIRRIGGPRAPYLSDDCLLHSPDTTHVLVLGMDCRRLVAIDGDGSVLWDEVLPQSGKLLGMSNSGRWVAIGTGGNVVLLDLDASESHALHSSHPGGIQGRVSHVALSDDNQTIAVYRKGELGTVEFLDFTGPTKGAPVSIDLPGGLRDMRFIGDRLLMVSGNDEVATVTLDGAVRTQTNVADPARRVCFYDDGLAFVSDSQMTIYRLGGQ
ncbi:MAG: hypothetical protein JSU73_05280 [candidate division WOR-3 bacterium]|nr:MAG: hypothetical protein JSU73_05280 [candidate division WOR-3 bacterium]